MEKEKQDISPESRPFEILDANKSRWNYVDQQAFLEQYVYLTDSLIENIQNFEVVDGTTYPADVIIFLDKSARPVSWLTSELWPQLAKPIEVDGEQVVPEMPDFKFVNIDRLAWRKNEGVPISDHPDNMKEISQEDIDGLRAIFGKRPAREGEQIANIPTHIDGKRVLIVDEINDSGDTMFVANILLGKAFPSAKFKTKAWMNRFKIAADGQKQVQEMPVWYKDNEESGRGIRDPLLMGKSESGKGVSSSVGPNSLLASIKPSITRESLKFMSTRPLEKRIMTDDEVARIEEIDRQIVTGGLDKQTRRRLEFERKHLEYDTVDKKGLKLRREIARIASMLSNLEIQPYVRNYNGDQDLYMKTRRSRVAQLNRTERTAKQ